MVTNRKFILLLVSLFIFSCNNEPIDTTKITAVDPILVDSQLYNTIKRVTDNEAENESVCIDFDYAFTVFIFDENLEYTNLQIIISDQNFSDFLGSLAENYSISISYPITYTTLDNEAISITNNDELKAVIDPCVEKEIIEECIGLLTQKDCVWKVINNPDGNNEYENAIFNVSGAGITTFTHNEFLYFGTWFSFTVELELHLNINLITEEDIADDWNRDWKTTILDENNMMLFNGSDVFLIQKECDPGQCNQFIFEECELSLGTETAEFNLESYIECFTNDIDISNSTLTFHITIEDMENGINALISPYTNIENPQSIYVRIEDNGTGEATFITIQIVVFCPIDEESS